MNTVNLGGDRLGSGNKMNVHMHGFERSTHNLEYIWRSTMAAGTIVPFLSEVALPEDTWDIDLNANVLTHPTLGPLFGSFKVQLDVFYTAIRLYNANLMLNATLEGNNMADIKLPLLSMAAQWNPDHADLENSQINPSSLFAYLGIRGLGATTSRAAGPVLRKFNAVPYFVYWDIYKNFYANKQEEVGYYIHNEAEEIIETVTDVFVYVGGEGTEIEQPGVAKDVRLTRSMIALITWQVGGPVPKWNQIIFEFTNGEKIAANQIWGKITEDLVARTAAFENVIINTSDQANRFIMNWDYIDPENLIDDEPELVSFPLSNIDGLRKNIMSQAFSPTAWEVNFNYSAPYGPPMAGEFDGIWSKMSSQEGLGIKTYQSDVFNNWLNSEWIDNVNAKSQVSTTGSAFNIEALIMAYKLYDHFNRIAVMDGSVSAWYRASYDTKGYGIAIGPIYMGGLSKELVFQQVISNSESTSGQPLGTLGGRGVMGNKHKGGKIRIKPEEIGYVTGNISLTPRIDYSQGNRWDMNLFTMEDFHKPMFDQIGFQDLITDQMYWPETTLSGTGVATFRSAGKQPAWMNYTTNYNRTYGNFAIAGNEMFMTLNRKYEPNTNGTIKDLTTYIDPVKYNQIFAVTTRDAQNFWVQIGVGITVRRKMSARQIPNM